MRIVSFIVTSFTVEMKLLNEKLDMSNLFKQHQHVKEKGFSKGIITQSIPH